MSETIILNGSQEAIEAIKNEISSLSPGSSIQVTERRNLDGNPDTWILFATLTAKAIGIILPFIRKTADGKNITKIRVGDVEIENPTPEMLEIILKNRKATTQDE